MQEGINGFQAIGPLPGTGSRPLGYFSEHFELQAPAAQKGTGKMGGLLLQIRLGSAIMTPAKGGRTDGKNGRKT